MALPLGTCCYVIGSFQGNVFSCYINSQERIVELPRYIHEEDLENSRIIEKFPNDIKGFSTLEAAGNFINELPADALEALGVRRLRIVNAPKNIVRSSVKNSGDGRTR